MSKKSRATVRLNEGEAYVVASQEFWEHISSTYRALSESADVYTEEDKLAWLSLADHVDKWVVDTIYLPDDGEDW